MYLRKDHVQVDHDFKTTVFLHRHAHTWMSHRLLQLDDFIITSLIDWFTEFVIIFTDPIGI